MPRKSPLSPEQIAALLTATKEGAAVLLEDLAAIRLVVEKPFPARPEIRHLIVILRRLLVERDLAKISAPRLGHVTLTAPDNNPAYKAHKQRPFVIFCSARANILGTRLSCFYLYEIPKSEHSKLKRIDLPSFDSSTFTELRIDTFMTQKVICYMSQWATRKDVIDYMAYRAYGIHPSKPAPLEPVELLLARVRKSVSVRRKPSGGINFEMFPHGFAVDLVPYKHAPDDLDMILLELLATARYLVESPFVKLLENTIRSELGISPPAADNKVP